MYIIMSSLQSFHFLNVGRVVIVKRGDEDERHDHDDEWEE